MNQLTSSIPIGDTGGRGRRSRDDLLLIVEAGVALALTVLLLAVSFAWA